MPGIIITLDGNSSGYSAMLTKSLTETKAVATQMQVSLNKQISVLQAAQSTAVPGSSNALAISQRLSAAQTELAQSEAVKMLAIKRASGVQLSLADALRLKNAGLEYRSLGTVAAETEARKVAANRAADAKIIQQDFEKGRALQAEQDAEVAAAAEAEAEKVAALEASQMAQLSIVARGYGARASFGGHGG